MADKADRAGRTDMLAGRSTSLSSASSGCGGDFTIGMDEEVFRRLLQGLSDGQEGIALRRIRLYQQMSLEEAATYAQISKVFLYRIEQGQRRARQKTLVKLCLISYSLSASQASELLLLAGYAPL